MIIFLIFLTPTLFFKHHFTEIRHSNFFKPYFPALLVDYYHRKDIEKEKFSLQIILKNTKIIVNVLNVIDSHSTNLLVPMY